MNFVLTKSSLLAALEISNDKKIKKFKNLHYLESHKTTLDIKNGKKIIETVGRDLIDKLNNTKKHYEKQLFLRDILITYIKKSKPGFMFIITGWRSYVLDDVSENFEQLLREAGHLEKIEFYKEG